MATTKLTAEKRTEQLAKIGYEIARSKGFKKVTRAEVSRRSGVSVTLVNRYFGDREGLRAHVLDMAVTAKDAATLADAGATYELPAMPRTLAAEVKKLMQ